jgi:hypothetical protein
MMIPISVAFGQSGKPKHQVTITQVKNGFIVDVQVIINQPPPLSEEEAQRRIGQFINKTQHNAQGSGDPALDKALFQARDEEQGQHDILGTRIFYSLRELQAFLTFVYEEEKEEKGAGKKK